MILLRVIPINRLTNSQINNLDQFGFTLVQRGDCLQIWVERAAHRD